MESEEIIGNAKNKISVAIVIAPSEKIISFLRLYLSAHTPATNEIKNCGRYEHIVNAATHPPLDVFKVTYQMIAICTIIEPNRVIH